MPVVAFTPNLARHVDCPPREVDAATVAEALAAAFDGNPRLRGYVLDDQGRLRQHVLVLIDGTLALDRDGLTDPVTETSSIYVAQALSGG